MKFLKVLLIFIVGFVILLFNGSASKAANENSIDDLLQWYSSSRDSYRGSEVIDNSLWSMRLKNLDGSLSLIIFPSPNYNPEFKKGDKVDVDTKKTRKSQMTSSGQWIHFQISGVTNTDKLNNEIQLPLKIRDKDSDLSDSLKFNKKQLAISSLDFQIRHQLTQHHGLYRSSNKTSGYWEIIMSDGTKYRSDLSKKFEYNTEKPPINIDKIKNIEVIIN